MTVHEIIEALKKMPQEAEMRHLWDGAARSKVDCVYLAQAGYVVVAPEYEPAYDDEDRPIGAPKEHEDQYLEPYEFLHSADYKPKPPTEVVTDWYEELDTKDKQV